ncbi:(5-formylfuran-3-yl)methyl phosphate synthase [Archaeoglobales archaeon]|nr:MAG: (5-formylfuran-3-yl)methyl phosphate synthase [Archaeoglobales archaeon]
MRVLVSPMSYEEAIECLNGGADIIDVKNPKEGSLGANFPWVISSIRKLVKENGKEISATTGDFDFKPGTASLAALGAAVAGADYIKVGLYGIKNIDQAYEVLKGVTKSVKDYDADKKVVGAAYADYSKINAISPFDLPEAAQKAEVDVIMIDTAIKDGLTLFDHLKSEQLEKFVDMARENGMLCALAGSINWNHLEALKKISPDIIGVRTIVCEGGRQSKIKQELVEKLMREMRF